MKSLVALVLLASLLQLNRKSVHARLYWQPQRDESSSQSLMQSLQGWYRGWNGGESGELGGGDSGEVGGFGSDRRVVQSYVYPRKDRVIDRFHPSNNYQTIQRPLRTNWRTTYTPPRATPWIPAHKQNNNYDDDGRDGADDNDSTECDDSDVSNNCKTLPRLKPNKQLFQTTTRPLPNTPRKRINVKYYAPTTVKPYTYKIKDVTTAAAIPTPKKTTTVKPFITWLKYLRSEQNKNYNVDGDGRDGRDDSTECDDSDGSNNCKTLPRPKPNTQLFQTTTRPVPYTSRKGTNWRSTYTPPWATPAHKQNNNYDDDGRDGADDNDSTECDDSDEINNCKTLPRPKPNTQWFQTTIRPVPYTPRKGIDANNNAPTTVKPYTYKMKDITTAAAVTTPTTMKIPYTYKMKHFTTPESMTTPTTTTTTTTTTVLPTTNRVTQHTYKMKDLTTPEEIASTTSATTIPSTESRVETTAATTTKIVELYTYKMKDLTTPEEITSTPSMTMPPPTPQVDTTTTTTAATTTATMKPYTYKMKELTTPEEIPTIPTIPPVEPCPDKTPKEAGTTTTVAAASTTSAAITNKETTETATVASKVDITTAATTEPITSESSPVPVSTSSGKGICNDCLMTNGVGYVSHPDCARYYQCYYDDNNQTNIRAVERKCSFGLFWNQKILSCDYPQNVPCSKDICSGSGPQPMEGNCKGFWHCNSGSPSGQCCPHGHSFNAQLRQCVPDVTCRDVCPARDVGAIICQKRAVPDKRSYNQWTQSGWVQMPCAPFTAFNPNTCGCSERIISQVPACMAEVYLPFDRSTDDQSDRKVYVENNGVRVSNGVAYFDGKGSLKINRFSSSWFGSTVVITVRYKVIDSSSRQSLVCNGDCDAHPTLFIGTNPEGVEFYAKTSESNKAVNFTFAQSSHGYQTAIFVLDEGKVTGQVGYNRHSQVAKGNLETTKMALTIGACGKSETFQGYIDEVSIYLCKPSTIFT